MAVAPNNLMQLAISMTRPLVKPSAIGPTNGAIKIKAITKNSCSMGICQSGADCDFNSAIAANSSALSANADTNCAINTAIIPREKSVLFAPVIIKLSCKEPFSFKYVGGESVALKAQQAF